MKSDLRHVLTMVIGLVVAVAASVGLAGVSVGGAAASADDLATVTGVVRPSTTAGWDGLVTVEYQGASGTYAVEADPVTGSYSIQVPTGTYRIIKKYHGAGNFLSGFVGGDVNFASSSQFSFPTPGNYTVSVPVVQGASITGTVSYVPEAPIEFTARYSSTPPTWANGPRVTFDAASGAYTVDRLFNLTVHFGANAGFGFSAVGESRKLPPGTSASANFEVTRVSGIRGSSPNASGVALYRNGTWVEGASIIGGRYEFNDIGAGTFTLHFGNESGEYQTQWWADAAT